MDKETIKDMLDIGPLSSKEVTVGGESFETIKANIQTICSCAVQVGTTGFCDGDYGHGSRLYFKLNWHDDGASNGHGGNTITFSTGGDYEIRNFITALKFATAVLEYQIAEKEKVAP